MTTERHKPNREQAVQPSSLRDYWLKPTGFPVGRLPELTRRTALSVITPSLWEQPPTLSASTRAPSDEHLQIGLAKQPDAPAEPITELTLAPLSGNEPSRLRDRLQRRGVDTLSTAELITLLLRTSGNEQMNQRISSLLMERGSLRELLRIEFGELSAHLGEARAAQLQAVLETARRLTIPTDEEKYTIQSPADAAALVRAEMEFLDHEELRVLVLNTKNQVEANLLLYQGTINSSVLRAAEIFRPAITRKCPNIIICHNHPSGDPTPSPEDIAVTEQLIEAGKVLDVELLDHLVIGHHHRFISLKERLLW